MLKSDTRFLSITTGLRPAKRPAPCRIRYNAWAQPADPAKISCGRNRLMDNERAKVVLLTDDRFYTRGLLNEVCDINRNARS